MKLKKKHLSALLFLFTLSATHPVPADQLLAFTTDGCSWFPDGNPGQRTSWLDCCIAHDYAYWKGGTRDDRVQADKALKRCVTQRGEPAVGWLMQFGVRIGGSPLWPTSFRWGYGWPYPRHYRALTEDELRQVEKQSGDFLQK